MSTPIDIFKKQARTRLPTLPPFLKLGFRNYCSHIHEPFYLSV